MSAKTVVIIGGVAGGMSVATRLRRNDEECSIIVFERGQYVSFANCGLAYHLGGQIPDRDDLLLHSPEELRGKYRLDVRTEHEVVAVDRSGKHVTVRDLHTGQMLEQPYDSLVIATGAKPATLNVPGKEHAFSLRTIDDMDAISKTIKSRQATSAVVIGAGFIGLELAENLRLRGLDVALVEAGPQVLPPLDPELAAIVQQRLHKASVDLQLGRTVSHIDSEKVELDNGTVLPADIVLSAIGVIPESGLAAEAGLAIDSRGGIEVDDVGRTSDPEIYAVGDTTCKRDAIDGNAVLIPLAQTANRHGRLVADAISGKPHRQPLTLGTAIVEVFGLTAATVGWNEKRLVKASRPFRVIHAHPNSHVTYYPGAEQMAIKLMFDPQTQAILGAAAVGGHGVDKRIDVIATAMRAGLTAPELADLELAYAPQFGAAKDPVNMLGMISENVANGDVPTVQWHELDAQIQDGAHVIDVREVTEFEQGSIPGSVNIPLDQLRDRVAEIPEGEVIVTCAVGQRGNTATRLLNNLGRNASNLDGGYRTWSTATSEQLAPR